MVERAVGGWRGEGGNCIAGGGEIEGERRRKTYLLPPFFFFFPLSSSSFRRAICASIYPLLSFLWEEPFLEEEGLSRPVFVSRSNPSSFGGIAPKVYLVSCDVENRRNSFEGIGDKFGGKEEK